MALKTVIVNNYINKSPSSNRLECRACKQRFYTTGNLIDHMSTHKHFLLHCNICNRGFSEQKNLDEHYLTHKEVKNTFDCHKCDKKFLQKHQLEYHMQFHAILTPISKTTQKKKTERFTYFQNSSNSDSEYAFDADTSEDYKPPTKKSKNTQISRKVKAKNIYNTDEFSESEEFASDDSRYDSMLPKKTKSGRTVKRKKFYGSESKTKYRRKNCTEHLDVRKKHTVGSCNKTSKKRTVQKCEKADITMTLPTTPVDDDVSVNTLLEKKKRNKITNKSYLLNKKQAKTKCMKFVDDNFLAENERTLIGFKKRIDQGGRYKRKYIKSSDKVEALSAKHLENMSQGPSLKSKVKRKLINEAFSRYRLNLQQSSNIDQGEVPNTTETTDSLQSPQNFNLKKVSVVLEKIPESICGNYAEITNFPSSDVNEKQITNQNKTVTSLKEKIDCKDLSKNISNQAKIPKSSTYKTPDIEFNTSINNNLQDSRKLNFDSIKNPACVSKTNEAKKTDNNQVKSSEKSDHTYDLLSNTKTAPADMSVNAKAVTLNKQISPKTIPFNKLESANQAQNPTPQIKITKPELKKSTTTQIAINVINPSGFDREFLYVGPQQDYHKITSVINEMESMSSSKKPIDALNSKKLQNTKNAQNSISSILSNDKLANRPQECEQGILEKKFIKDFVFVKVTREYMEKIQQEKSNLLIKRGSIEPNACSTAHTVKPAIHSDNLLQVKPVKEIFSPKIAEKIVEKNIKPVSLPSQSDGTAEKRHVSPSTSSKVLESSNPLTFNASIDADNAESSNGENVVIKSVDKNSKTNIGHSSKIINSKTVSANIEIKNNLKDIESETNKITILNLNTGVEKSLQQVVTEIKSNIANATEIKNKKIQLAGDNALCLENNKMVVSDCSNSKQTYVIKKSTNQYIQAKSENCPKIKEKLDLSPHVSKANDSNKTANSSTNESTVKSTKRAESNNSHRNKIESKLSPKISAIDRTDDTFKPGIGNNIDMKEYEKVPSKQVSPINSGTNRQPKDQHTKKFKNMKGEKIEFNSSQVVSPDLSEKVLQRYKEKIEEKERKKREKYELKKKLRTEEKFSTNSPDKTCTVEKETEKLTFSKDKMHSSKSEEMCTIDENISSKVNHKSNSKSKNRTSPSKALLKSDINNDATKHQSKVKVTYAIRFTPKSEAQHEKLKSKPCKTPDEEAIEKAYEISLKFQKALSEEECLTLLHELDSLITNFNISKKCPFLFTIIRFCRLYMDSYKVKEQAISLHTKLTKDLL